MWRFLSICLLALIFACDDVDEFIRNAERPYLGSVVGGEGESFIRVGFAPGTVMELEFDAARAVATASSDAESGDIDEMVPIGVVTTDDGAFDRVELEIIPSLQHDQLGDYDFPGGGRFKNFLFSLRPTRGPLSGREAYLFLSLLDSGRAEARIVVGNGIAENAGYFGLFLLE